jgi:hypothetical protein
MTKSEEKAHEPRRGWLKNGNPSGDFTKARTECLNFSLDLSPFLAQTVKAQHSSNGEFESWGYRAGSSRKSLRLPRCGG